jgi:hypothetical protein
MSIIFLVVTPRILVEFHKYFGGTYCLHLQGRKMRQGSSERETGSSKAALVVNRFVHFSTLMMEAILKLLYNIPTLPPQFTTLHPWSCSVEEYPEDGENRFLWNICKHLPVCTVLHPTSNISLSSAYDCYDVESVLCNSVKVFCDAYAEFEYIYTSLFPATFIIHNVQSMQ